MVISCDIDIHSAVAVCFDPFKVRGLLKSAFPEATVDPQDQATEEVERIIDFLQSKGARTWPDEDKATMLAWSLGKALRNGPVYSIAISLEEVAVKGILSRYSVCFISDDSMTQASQERIIAFLQSLGFGEIRR